jgi:hypothetical protein
LRYESDYRHVIENKNLDATVTEILRVIAEETTTT